MRKVVFLLAVVALAAAPSLASAKTKHHRAHQAKVVKDTNPNANTVNLFANMFK